MSTGQRFGPEEGAADAPEEGAARLDAGESARDAGEAARDAGTASPSAGSPSEDLPWGASWSASELLPLGEQLPPRPEEPGGAGPGVLAGQEWARGSTWGAGGPTGQEWARGSTWGPDGPTGQEWARGSTWGPDGPDGPDGPNGPDGPTGSGRSAKRKVAVVVVAASLLVAAGLGSGITYALTGGNGGSAPVDRSPLPVAAASSVNQPASTINVTKIAQKVEPAVVDITSTLAFGQGSAAGTGMIVTPSGEVVTNNHVVEGASKVSVKIAGHSGSYAARVIGTDAKADVAVLQIEGITGLPTVTLGNSSSVAVGDAVVAIGNALDLPGAPSVTEGTISALDRSVTAGAPNGATEHLTGMLQTDAPISSGDSGGPLLNAAAQVIGMDTAAAGSGSGATVSNVAFAIPVDTVTSVADQIVAGHAGNGVVIGQPGFLGVEVTSVGAAQSPGFGSGFGSGFGGQAVAPASSGALVVGVISGGPAAQAGIAAGDVITGFDGKSISSPSALTAAMAGTRPGEAATLRWMGPSGNTHTATLTLANGPIP